MPRSAPRQGPSRRELHQRFSAMHDEIIRAAHKQARYDLLFKRRTWSEAVQKDVTRKRRLLVGQEVRELRRIAARTAECERRLRRRQIMFALGVSGVAGARWSKMMRGAHRDVESSYSCR